MSRLADLINELCPDGVEYKSIGSFADCVAGATPKTTDPTFWDGDIPWMSSGEANKGTVYSTDRFITKAGYDSCSTKMVPPGAVVIALAGQGKTRGTVARTRIELCTNQSLCSILPQECVNSDFLYHFLAGEYDNLRAVSSGDGTRGGLNLKMIRAYKVPVPPLEVQREIVKILDQFTTLEAELEAELEARRAQYEYYRNQLLSYDALASRGPVEWVKLGEVASKIITGVTPKAADPKYYQDATNPWIRTQDVNFCRINEASAFVTDQAVAELPLKWVSPHSVVVAISGASAGRSAILNIRAVTNQHCCNIEINSKLADFRYVYYCIASCYEQLRNLGRGARGDLNVSIIKSFEIPLPALYEQRYIADILDRFDALVNDISSGLPAEIAARRAQYEYYRDRLLSFPEKK